MSGRRLVFLNRAANVPPADGATDYAVLDSAWTPAPGERDDLIPIRPVLWNVIRERNLHDESLAALDAWADRAGLVERFRLGDVSWWFHARSFVRLDVHELLLWRIVLDQLAPPGRYEQVEVPSDRPLLLAALQAPQVDADDGDGSGLPVVSVRSARTGARTFGGGKPSRVASRRRPWYRRAISRTLRLTRRTLDIPARLQQRAVRARLRRLVRERADVLAIVRGESYHLVRGQDGEERFDPIVTPVLRRLLQQGTTAAVIVIGLHDDDAADAEVPNDAPIPFAAVANLLLTRSDQADDRAELAQRLEGLEAVPLALASVDVAPVLTGIIGGLDRWLARQLREQLVARRLLEALRPRVVLTGWEAARTAWLAAARARGAKSVAIQHGVIYPNNPDYYRPIRPELIRPDLTCTFGAFERQLLVDDCGYGPDAVAATGSPRASGLVMTPLPAAVRTRIRRSLAVGRGQRMLVLSAARHAIGEELQSTTIFGRVLDGPLPGVHVVVKLHPEEASGEHYVELLEGLAAAGGWSAPPITVVRDIDLFDLLRAADAHLGIYSTVLTDAVLAGTPNMIAVGQAWSDLLGYVAAGVAQPVTSVEDVRAFMADPKAPAEPARAAFLEAHYASADGAGQIADAVTGLLGRAERAA